MVGQVEMSTGAKESHQHNKKRSGRTKRERHGQILMQTENLLSRTTLPSQAHRWVACLLGARRYVREGSGARLTSLTHYPSPPPLPPLNKKRNVRYEEMGISVRSRGVAGSPILPPPPVLHEVGRVTEKAMRDMICGRSGRMFVRAAAVWEAGVASWCGERAADALDGAGDGALPTQCVASWSHHCICHIH